jgi:hypothetical protein
MNINGNVTLTAGTYTAGASTNVAGNWTNNGGTFTPGTGTVNFNSTTAAQAINGTAATQTFNNITVAKTAQTLSVGGSTTTLTLNGAMTLTSGTFTAPATINIAGNWTNNASFASGSSNVTLDGAGEQLIRTGGAASKFSTLTITNTSTNCVNFVDALYADNLIAQGINKIYFAAGQTHVIYNNLRLMGPSTGHMVLTSLGSGEWSITPPANYTLSNLQVYNSRNTAGGYLNPVESDKMKTYKWGNLNGGNTFNWFQDFVDEGKVEEAVKDIQTPEPPKNEVNPETSISLDSSMVSVPEEDEDLMKKKYVSGKYRTVVIVFEGRVLVSPYDEEGVKEKEATTLTAGQKSETEGEVK